MKTGEEQNRQTREKKESKVWSHRRHEMDVVFASARWQKKRPVHYHLRSFL